MELHQRSELRREMTGADVALLHFELRLLGLRIPEAELAANLFGNDTHAAVAQFQSQSRLPITGVVERETAKRINSTVAERVSAAQILDLLWTEINRYHDQIKQLQTDNPRLQAEIQRLNQILDGLQREHERVKNEATGAAERNAELERLLAAARARIQELESSPNGRTDQTFVVHGHVRQVDGRPQVNGSVHALDRGLRNEQELGNARLDSAGHYQITYSADQFTRNGKERADLLIRVLDSAGNLLVSSPIMYNAPADATIDLVISDDEPRTLSEYERLIAKVTPLLQGVALADLSEDQQHQDISFLAGETGEDWERIELLVLAHRLQQETEIPAELFYGCFRQGLPNELAQLQAQDIAVLQQTLGMALEKQIIPAVLRGQINQLLQRLRTISARQPVFLSRADVLFGARDETDSLSAEESAFLDAKLNARLRSAILEAIGPTSAPLRRSLRSSLVTTDYRPDRETALMDVARTVLQSVARHNRHLAEEVAAIQAKLVTRRSETVRSVLALDTPLGQHPLFTADTRRVLTLEYARLAQVSESVAQRLAQQSAALPYPDESMLDELVTDGALTEPQRQTLRLVVDLAKLTGDQLPLVARLQATGLNSVTTLATWEPGEWEAWLAGQNLNLPREQTIQTYARVLRANVEHTFATQSLTGRLTSPKMVTRIQLLDTLENVLQTNERLIDGTAPAVIDWERVNPTERAALQQRLTDMTALANTYRHLGIADLVNAKQLSLADRKQAIAGRVALVHTLFAQNPELDLRVADLSTTSTTINWDPIPLADRPALRQQLMAYQRTLNLTDDVELSRTLLAAGYDSAFAIADIPKVEFTAVSGLTGELVDTLYARAQQKSSATGAAYWASTNVLQDSIIHTNTVSLYPYLTNDLLEIDGFDKLFGSQNFCDCAECKSIFSPAAYFVDLMNFIEKHVSRRFFIRPGNTLHPLYLHYRRPDLWKLPLTCENTHTLVPYLTIVNEVLEAHLTTLVGKDIYDVLSNKEVKLSFTLPFSLPHEELYLYLGHFGIAPHDIYRLLGHPVEKARRARLGLSSVEFAVITEPDPTGVKYRFGNPQSLVKFPVQEFIRLAGITRVQLNDLLALQFNLDLAKITVTTEFDADQIQIVNETLNNLTNQRLDFIHRFVRLWKKTGWSIRDFDLVLVSLRDAQLINGLNATTVRMLAQVVDSQAELKVSLEEVCAFFHDLPVSRDFPKLAERKADLRLYERLFDLVTLFGEDSNTHVIGETTDFHHYSLNRNHPDDRTIDPKTPTLLGGLGITESELLQLFSLLQDTMPFDDDGNTKLDRHRISLLYRHARLAKALRLNVDDFIQILYLCFTPHDAPITTFSQIELLRDFQMWLRTSPFSVAELRLILKGEATALVPYKTDLATVVTLVKEIQEAEKSGALAVFTDEAKQAQENIKLTALRARLVQSFNLTRALLDNVLQWSVSDMKAEVIETALATSLTEEGALSKLNPLLTLLQDIERVLLLFSNLRFKEQTVDYITHHPLALGIPNLKQLTLANLKALTFYKQLIAVSDSAEPQVQAVLESYQLAGKFSTADNSRLADLWKQPTSLLASLTTSLTLPATAINAIEYLWQCLDLCRTLGINGYSLQILGKDNAAETQAATDTDMALLRAARDVALGAFSSKYDDEKVRQEKLEPYQDQINVKKRDALCDYVIVRQELKFKDLQDLYAFFLLDVEMSGCFRTSRLVCAISSLQLYVHRCLIQLERSDPDLNPLIKNLAVEPPQQMIDQWEWRKNYRVWEANRKVFLYPENYIEPDLRDNKTPLFKELEEELLQEKITLEAAEAAYRKYIAQFAELARLRIAGSYYHEQTATYYFFGRTQQDPPQYYYRTWDGKVWTPWEKIELAINAQHVTAVIHLGKLYLFWVEIKTTEKTEIKDGTSESLGYESDIDLLYTFQTEHRRWLTPQRLVLLDDFALSPQNIEETKAWKRVYPDIALIGKKQHLFVDYGYGYSSTVDLFLNSLNVKDGYVGSTVHGQHLTLYKSGTQGGITTESGGTTNELSHEAWRIRYGPIPSTAITTSFDDGLIKADLDIVHNKGGDYVLKLGNQQYLVQYNPPKGVSKRYMIRLNTSLVDELGETLFTQGLEAFLSLETQKNHEHPIGIDIPFNKLPELFPPFNEGWPYLDFRGAYGEYYRELFFHVPFLIANHLNANQKFKEAKWWYERIFDPTASPGPEPTTTTGHNWRYIEFRTATLPKLKAVLTDPAAIQQYAQNPFNPHAIARLRVSAYQKTIVMKYIDNLLDWGDHLFAQDTMESINEATMLYVLAADTLGKRPTKFGPCKTASDAQLTYQTIDAENKTGAEILITLENFRIAIGAGADVEQLMKVLNAASNSVLPSDGTAQHSNIALTSTTQLLTQPRVLTYQDAATLLTRKQQTIYQVEKTTKDGIGLTSGVEVAKWSSTLAFCVPPNDILLGYWDRVADRLFKIRHCMNISGVRRTLALFQPPIDPMALVRARAAGLSLEEILADHNQTPPPYRFNYLIEKAKQFTQTVQSFGGTLLSALEKKDVEELTLLRSVHERNILRLTRQIKRDQIREAQFQLQALTETKTNVQNRIDYYQGLLDEGLILPENAQQIAQHSASGLQIEAAVPLTMAAISYLIPQLGSPFALKFGGKENGDAAKAAGQVIASAAAVAQAIAASSGIIANFERRTEEWNQQLLLAQRELLQVEQHRLGAEVRVQIAEKDLEIHEKTIEQADELHEFYRDKFTNLGLYTYLATTLTRLYRAAYNVAYDMAKMAERAYRFERNDNTPFIAGDNWRFDRAGLLAGEQLLLQLQQLERTYLAQHTRDYEVTQSFSLAMFAPNALFALRQTGGCTFTLPEFFFDLYYPGQYRRLIKSARLTIPCIAGPYTNIGAKLTLKGSSVRKEASTEVETMVLALPSQPSIATSTAQNDGGLFELNFRDERYLPFEGAGAVDSKWNLDLPAALRPFDYDTITDVVLHLSYTARDDSTFRSTVEDQIHDTLISLAETPGLFRLLSLKHEFPSAFYRLLHPSEVTQSTEFTLTRQHFPFFLHSANLTLSSLKVYLTSKRQEPVSTDGLILTINNKEFKGWIPFDQDTQNVMMADGLVPGPILKKWTINTGESGFDPEELDDILLLVNYTVAFSN